MTTVPRVAYAYNNTIEDNDTAEEMRVLLEECDHLIETSEEANEYINLLAPDYE